MTSTQSYRNPRQGFYTDLTVDTTPVGAIVPNLKTGTNSFDHNFVKYGATAFPVLTESAGNAYLLGDDPAYTHDGYLYCNGDEYNIGDFPSLYQIIGNKYGGRSSSGIDVITGGEGYTSAPSITISDPPTGGITATCEAVVESGKIKHINLLLPGKGYTEPPSLTLTGGFTGNGTGSSIQGYTNVLAYIGGIFYTVGNNYTTTPYSGSGLGSGATVNILTIGTYQAGGIGTIAIASGGTGYVVGDKLKINHKYPGAIMSSTYVSGEGANANRTGGVTYAVEVLNSWTSADGEGGEFNVVVAADGSATLDVGSDYIPGPNGNRGWKYVQNETITIPSSSIGGGDDLVLKVNSVTGDGERGSIEVTSVGAGGASFEVRLGSDGDIEGINTNNVMEWWGDPYLGTFCVPDLKTKKVVGNGPVFGQNSPNVGNSQLGVGTTGGAWYLAKEQQDEYFSLGRIVTSGYDQVVESTECSIIGQQQIEITMRESKLSGAPQHNHTVYHSEPGFNSFQAEASGDRYLQDYREGKGRLSRWYPTGGIVFTHKHGLLRSPITDNTVATYDVFDAVGGAGGCGSIKDPSATDKYYMASGASDAGTWEFQTYIPEPVMKKFTGSSNIGGRTVNSGGTAVYDYSDEWEFTSPGSYSINLGNVSGTPDRLIYQVIGGGGSGAAGTSQGNDGGDSVIVVGSELTLTAEGGTKGGASSGMQGGTGGAGGQATSSGSVSAGGALDGFDGANGGTGQTSLGFPLADYPNDPMGGGQGGTGGDYGKGSNGINLLIGGQSGTFTETLTGITGTFNFVNASGGIITNPSSVNFVVAGGKGGTAGRGGYTGYNGAVVSVDLVSSELDEFNQGTWSFVRGTAAGGRMNGSGDHGGNGGYGGEGHQEADGGGGGACSIIKRGTQTLVGAGGGGGAGASGYDGGAGVNGSGPPSGYSSPDATTQALGTGGGGTGGHYGCIGGGGGGGGSGVARNGITFGGIGNGGASGGPGGAPGGDGGHQGGAGGQSGVSSYRSDWFTLNSFSHSNDYGGVNNGNGYATATVVYNNDYWTSGGGGGGAGGLWAGDIGWTGLNNPGSISVTVGAGGAGINPGGQTTGSTASGDGGYVKIGLGKIVGYSGGQTGTSVGDIVAAGSQDNTVWDVNVVGNGQGTGTAGNFKLPTTQVPDVYIVGGGATTLAEASVTVANNKVTAITLDSAGAGYTETPYVYVMNGAGGGTKITSTIDTQAENIDQLLLTANSSTQYTNYVKFGGLSGTTGTRFIELVPVDTTNTHYFSIKACRGNGVNGGDVAEEVLRVYYQPADTTGWTLIDTIITPNSVRTDPIIGDVPIVSTAWDGASGATQWYTYSVGLPQNARGVGTKIKIEQPRATPSASNDNDLDSDHYGIAEFIYWNEKVTGLVFVPTAGKISKSAVDKLAYTVQGETGPGITYSSGLQASEATLTLKSTTKIEPQATIDPDIDVPLITTYRLCKYLIKAF